MTAERTAMASAINAEETSRRDEHILGIWGRVTPLKTPPMPHEPVVELHAASTKQAGSVGEAYKVVLGGA